MSPKAGPDEKLMALESPLNISVQFEEEGTTKAGGTILRLRRSPKRGGSPNITPDRLTLAAEWAIDLDAQYRELILTDHSPLVVVPAKHTEAVSRAERDTLPDYRKLQLSLGELIRPLLLKPPESKKLYPFQRQGVDWLTERDGGILADDMGLGKTVQVISAMRSLFNRAELRTSLIVCPKSLIATWEREFSRWAPELGVAVLTPPAKLREDAWKVVVGRRHVLLTNYEQLRQPPQVLRQTPPDLVVADEAHRIRKRNSQITSGIIQLEPKRFWALTGTPLERDLEDLATLLSLVAPKSFAPADAKLHPSSLRSRARSYVLRRRKQEVLEELPPVLDTTDTLELSEAQKRAYQTAVREYRLKGEKGDELTLLTRLQALCDLDPDSRESCKIERILHLLGRIREQREKAVVFSYRLEPLRELQHRITERWEARSGIVLWIIFAAMNERSSCSPQLVSEAKDSLWWRRIMFSYSISGGTPLPTIRHATEWCVLASIAKCVCIGSVAVERWRKLWSTFLILSGISLTKRWSVLDKTKAQCGHRCCTRQ